MTQLFIFSKTPILDGVPAEDFSMAIADEDDVAGAKKSVMSGWSDYVKGHLVRLTEEGQVYNGLSLSEAFEAYYPHQRMVVLSEAVGILISENGRIRYSIK